MDNDWQAYTVVEDHTNKTHCECCASYAYNITGDLLIGEEYKAFFSVRWTENHSESGAVFAIFCGNWSEGGPQDERFLIGLDFIVGENGGFGLHEHPEDFLEQYSDMNPNYLKRSDILGSKFASELFTYVDAIFMKDTRLDTLRGWSSNA